MALTGIPWTENQETWIQSQVPLFASESSCCHLVQAHNAEGQRSMVWGSCSWTPTASGNRDSPEMTGKWNVVRKRGDLLRAFCKVGGGVTRRLASWLGQFLPAALQDSQDSGQMAFAANELPVCDKGK